MHKPPINGQFSAVWTRPATEWATGRPQQSPGWVEVGCRSAVVRELSFDRVGAENDCNQHRPFPPARVPPVRVPV